MKHKKLIIVLGSIVSFILLIIIVFACYFGNYYHSKTTNYYLTSSENTIVKDEEYLTFSPKDKTDTGIIFYPGAKVEYTAYAELMYKLSLEGYFCVLVDMPLNFAIFGMDIATDVIDEYDIDNWYIIGHSLGAAMGSSYASANKDKIDGVIMLAGYSTSDLNGLDVLSIYGSNDEVLNMDNYIENKSNLGLDYIEYIIDGGNHAYFGNYGEQKGDGKSTITKEEQINLTVKQIVKFLNKE